MTKTFTENDLIRFIYGETSGEEHLAISTALVCDAEIMETYLELKETASMFDGEMLTPRKKVIQDVLNYSKNFDDLSVLK